MGENEISYADLIEKMQMLKGYRIRQEIDFLNITLYVFNGNFLQLNQLIDIYENDEEIWYLINRQKLDALSMEIIRSFHNYLSSVSSRIDHMRRFREKLDNKKVDDFHERELEKIKNLEVVVFMKKLRNYIQHRALPHSKVTWSTKLIDGKNLYETNHRFALDQHKLLEWDNWNSKSKSYINSFNGDIELKLCCKEYHEKMKEFDLKFLKMVVEEYKNDFIEHENFSKKDK